MRVLVVDDHDEVRELVGRALARDGCTVDVTSTLAAARARVAASPPDVIVLDVGLPDGSGVDLCRELRRASCTAPILLLTARAGVGDRVAGLDGGADDYMAKPFAVAELRARVRALARRGPLGPQRRRTVGDVELDFAARLARRAGAAVPLTAREWSVLELLALRAGRVVGRHEILEVAWGDVTDETRASLDVIVARIRRKLGDAVVRTLRGEGYAFGA